MDANLKVTPVGGIGLALTTTSSLMHNILCVNELQLEQDFLLVQKWINISEVIM